MTCFSRTRFIGQQRVTRFLLHPTISGHFEGQQRVTRFLLHPTISGHFEGGNLITSWSCGVFYQNIFDGQLITSIEACFFPKPDFGLHTLIFEA